VEYVAMSDDEQSGSDDPGIFGSLPSSRPGTRSPRRAGDSEPAKRKATAKAKATKSTRTAAASGSKAKQAPPPPPPPPATGPAKHERDQPTPKPGDGQTGIEDLAWAGVAAAAEAATLGVRLATRALETVRRAAER
jgi:hypothetical protein